MEKILIIKLGALGDFIQATGAFADIRAKHKSAKITLLTTKGMVAIASKAPWVDIIYVDRRGSLFNPFYLWEMYKKLSGFDFIYDLQTNNRTNIYHILAGRPKWSGIAKGCSNPHKDINRNNLHTLDRLAGQLVDAGVAVHSSPNIFWAAESSAYIMKKYDLSHFALLVPGGSAHRKGKRWPHFAVLTGELMDRGYKVALIGGKAEEELLKELAGKTGAINLCGKTTLNQLVDLCTNAALVVGNDTGPMHIAAAADSPGVVLFGKYSNPKLCAPRADEMHVIVRDDIASISPQEVLDVLGV